MYGMKICCVGLRAGYVSNQDRLKRNGMVEGMKAWTDWCKLDGEGQEEVFAMGMVRWILQVTKSIST